MEYKYERPVPLATVERLSVYLRTLIAAQKKGESHISSSNIAKQNGYTPAQVRKDLTCFGSFGRKGQGYPVDILIEHIQKIIGIDHSWNICLIGFGNLGFTLAKNMSIFNKGFNLVSIFDVKPEIIGTHYNGVPILHENEITNNIKDNDISIGIVAVPEESAEKVIKNLIEAGIQGILNFSAVRVPPPDDVFIKDVNIGGHLETITFYLTNPGRMC
ncbi:MAG: redox-sensing transcriptional repressor Rex [Candidatus Zixiibacteriota bacterium]